MCLCQCSICGGPLVCLRTDVFCSYGTCLGQASYHWHLSETCRKVVPDGRHLSRILDFPPGGRCVHIVQTPTLIDPLTYQALDGVQVDGFNLDSGRSICPACQIHQMQVSMMLLTARYPRTYNRIRNAKDDSCWWVEREHTGTSVQTFKRRGHRRWTRMLVACVDNAITEQGSLPL